MRRRLKHQGQPTVILAKTVKGYGMGLAGEGQNITHQQKKMNQDAVRAFRDRFNIPIPDEQLAEVPFYKPEPDSPEIKYLHEQRQALGGYLPQRQLTAIPLELPELSIFDTMLKGSGDREFSTTMSFVRMLSALARDKKIGQYVVPIVPDEARTFGMEGLFRQLGIYSSQGQLYEPQDADQVMYYKEDKKGQILEEGICEAGAISSWIAAGSAYSNHGINMIPFYIFYSMFGFQRVGDLAWAAGDIRVRGFLIGGTAGRTTLSGEGLQHQDGHSLIAAANIPNCVSYDPTFAYEMAVIIHDGLRRMYKEQENIFYYITAMNENYQHPPMPEGVQEGIIKGMYLFKQGVKKTGHRVQLLGSGTILREVIAASSLLAEDFDVTADIWSVTSFTELRRDGLEIHRWNMLHPEAEQKNCYLYECLKETQGPVIAATDYIKLYADQIRPCLPPNTHYYVLGTDGFGRSDSRRQLRKFFEVDRYYITLAALKGLADLGEIPANKVTEALEKYQLDADKPNPMTV
jgi:pyruvate dehydrogenase E1 component